MFNTVTDAKSGTTLEPYLVTRVGSEVYFPRNAPLITLSSGIQYLRNGYYIPSSETSFLSSLRFLGSLPILRGVTGSGTFVSLQTTSDGRLFGMRPDGGLVEFVEPGNEDEEEEGEDSPVSSTPVENSGGLVGIVDLFTKTVMKVSNFPTPSTSVSDFLIFNDVMYVAHYSNAIYRSLDFGETWETALSATVNRSKLFASKRTGKIYGITGTATAPRVHIHDPIADTWDVFGGSERTNHVYWNFLELEDRIVITAYGKNAFTINDDNTISERIVINSGSNVDYFAAVGNGVIVCPIYQGQADANHVMVSSDGLAWEKFPIGIDMGNLRDIAFVNGMFVLFGYNAVATSVDGRHWTTDTITNRNTNHQAARNISKRAYGDKYVISAGASGDAEAWFVADLFGIADEPPLFNAFHKYIRIR